jgi:serine/threonine-protein kinase
LLTLRALGGVDLRATDGSEIVAVLAQPKRFAVLVYLATSTQQGATSRDLLLSRFWPQRDAAHARQSLNQALRFLRRALGPRTIVSRGESTVRLDASMLEFDVWSFDDACDRGDFRGAVELYRGDFLDGFFVSDASAAIDDWIARERTRLRRSAHAAMWSLSERAGAAGDADDARHWARRAAALAPDDERGMRRLVELLHQLGDRGGALRAYDEFAGLLARELGVSPSKESQRLVACVRATDGPGETTAAVSAVSSSSAATRARAPVP